MNNNLKNHSTGLATSLIKPLTVARTGKAIIKEKYLGLANCCPALR